MVFLAVGFAAVRLAVVFAATGAFAAVLAGFAVVAVRRADGFVVAPVRRAGRFAFTGAGLALAADFRVVAVFAVAVRSVVTVPLVVVVPLTAAVGAALRSDSIAFTAATLRVYASPVANVRP